MTRMFFGAAALVATLATPAFAADGARKFAFTRDGVSYVAFIRDRGATQTISGYEVGSGRSFDLRIADGKVSGDYAGNRVAYPVAQATRGIETAAR